MEAGSVTQSSTGLSAGSPTGVDRAPISELAVTVDGVRSPVLQAGPADATEAVVMVHGNPGSKSDFTDLIGRVGTFARVVAPDQPGFGQADKPADFDYTAFGMAMQLSGIITELGIERVHFVGHDWGGGLVLGAGLLDPGRLASMTLMNTGVMRGYEWHTWARIWQTPILGELAMLVTNREGFRRGMKGLPLEFVDEMYDNFDRGTRRAVLKLYRSSKDVHQQNQMLATMYRALDPPTCIIWGAGDQYVPVKFAKRNLEAFPSGELHILDDAGHWPFVDQPDAVGEILCDFLRRQIG